MGWTRLLLLLLALLVAADLTLLLKGWQVLVWQTATRTVLPGVPAAPLLTCTYWAGTRFEEQWFDRAQGRGNCPILFDARLGRAVVS